ncbi:MAG: M1 family metallopeptidase [Micromonosporaceae bacterium]
MTAGGIRKALLAATVLLATLVAGCQAPPSATWNGPPPDPDAPVDYAKGRSAPVADPVYPEYGNPALDVLHYQLGLTWSPEDRTLTGEAVLTVRPTRRVEELVLDFSPALKVSKASLGGTPVTTRQRRNDLVVALPEPAEKDSQLTLTVAYRGTPKPVPMPSTRGDFDDGVGLRVEDDGAIWTMQEPYGAFTWYPANDQPSDEALYDITVTVPEGWSGVASGEFVGSTERSDGQLDFRWRSEVPVGSYVTTLAVDKFARHYDTAGDVRLTYWVPEEYDEYQLAAMRRSPELLAWLAERFGPYPFPSAGAVAVDSDSAMETQMMVTMGGMIAEELEPEEAEQIFTRVLVHEYAHQWFGDTVSPRDWRGVWLNEGFATYAEMLWVLEDSDISEAGYVHWLRERDRESRAEAGPPGNYNPKMFAEGNVYVGPALMLHEIRKTVGDKTFFALCREWAQQHRETNQDRATFTAFVNEYTGKDLTPVIDEWLDAKTTPPPAGR